MSIKSHSGSAANLHNSKHLGSFLNHYSGKIRWTSLGLILIAFLLLMRTLPTERVLGSLQNWIDGLGIWGPLTLGLLYILAALLFIPGSVLTLASGAIFGLAWGTIVVSLASTTEFDERLSAFMNQYNSHHCHPYRWTYTGEPLVRSTPFSQARHQHQRGRAWFSPRPKTYEQILYPPRPYKRQAA